MQCALHASLHVIGEASYTLQAQSHYTLICAALCNALCTAMV
ncbi:hypothetical protein SPHINGO391_520032 [Sphingomonas aurantiaca]|uniref:Uncharacterized protein n=1 Tax=Sphingomonas aurantiaca TaxID=185949 RepID=A0A5E8AM19_9SPHN|nr:hypothetical protein SPHINGO391_520032 [Sphingomonas aurantiaca]VXC99458.1 hypothetical protein SPHINGOT1_280012 [Sphingomonas sp. T1]